MYYHGYLLVVFIVLLGALVFQTQATCVNETDTPCPKCFYNTQKKLDECYMRIAIEHGVRTNRPRPFGAFIVDTYSNTIKCFGQNNPLETLSHAELAALLNCTALYPSPTGNDRANPGLLWRFERAATNDFLSAARSFGIVQTHNLTFAENSTAADYEATLGMWEQNRTANPDLLFIASAPHLVLPYIEKLRAQRVYDPKMIFVSNGAALNELNNAFKWQAEYITDAIPWISTFDNYTDEYYGTPTGFKRAFENRTGKALQLFHVTGYISGYILEKAFQKVASFEKVDIIDAIRSLDLMSLWGPINFTPQGYITAHPACRQILNNKIETIAPSELATGVLVYPGYPNRPPPPRFSSTDRLMMKIFGTLAGVLVLLAIASAMFYWITGKWHFITIPKANTNDEWGSPD